jgi:8-oxo-dGTP pyrophosphatase MutT (NUDIX family)
VTSLATPEEIAGRRAHLEAPHMACLAAFAMELRGRLPGFVPDMDPLDGGVRARILLLLEKPGPQAGRTGLVSRDNPSPTSAALRAFLEEAGLPREETLLWNVVPAWNGTIRLTSRELRDGPGHLPTLLALLPRLDTAILVGRQARRAEPHLSGLRVLRSAHPSPQVRAAFPDRWAEIPQIWAQAREVL